MSKKEESKKTDQAIVPQTKAELTNPESAKDLFAADAGAGMEGAGMESFALPFLMILQKNSPQVDPASGAVVDGAKAGMLFENISRNLVDGKDGVMIIPCAYRRVFLRWSESKGFQGELLPEDVAHQRTTKEIVEFKGRLYVPEKDGSVDPDESDRVVDTRSHYVLIVDSKTGVWRQALMSLSSTQIKKSRALMTALASVKVEVSGKLITPPTFANLVKATTVPESNDKGTWMGWHFELTGFVQSADLYAAAKQFHQSVTSGRVETKYADVKVVEGDDASEKGF